MDMSFISYMSNSFCEHHFDWAPSDPLIPSKGISMADNVHHINIQTRLDNCGIHQLYA